MPISLHLWNISIFLSVSELLVSGKVSYAKPMKSVINWEKKFTGALWKSKDQVHHLIRNISFIGYDLNGTSYHRQCFRNLTISRSSTQVLMSSFFVRLLAGLSGLVCRAQTSQLKVILKKCLSSILKSCSQSSNSMCLLWTTRRALFSMWNMGYSVSCLYYSKDENNLLYSFNKFTNYPKSINELFIVFCFLYYN